MKLEDYAIRIEPLPREEGGGFLVTVPDLSGCVADRETIDAVIAEAHDVLKAWAVAEEQDKGDFRPRKHAQDETLTAPSEASMVSRQ